MKLYTFKCNQCGKLQHSEDGDGNDLLVFTGQDIMYCTHTECQEELDLDDLHLCSPECMGEFFCNWGKEIQKRISLAKLEGKK